MISSNTIYKGRLDILVHSHKKKLCHIVLTLILTLGLVFAKSTGMQAQAKTKQEKPNLKYASIVMDADTGLILHQRYANKKLHPASLTKVMTLVMVFEAIRNGKLSLNERIRISSNAAKAVPSKLDLPPGASIRVKDAISILVTKSANDIAIAVAEHIGGTERNFARMMTRSARLMGMKNTTFVNASGLHDPRQISTARDMAKMAQTVIKKYPREYKYFSQKSFRYNGKTYKSHNRLMNSYKGMDGMKTGYVRASGFNLVASAVRDNQRLIAVVFGGRSAKSRNTHMAALLDSGFNKMSEIRIANAPIPKRKPQVATLAYTQSLQKNNTAINDNNDISAPQHAQFNEIITHTTSNQAVSSRIETGLAAVTAHKKQQRSGGIKTTNISYDTLTPHAGHSSWAVQIGAFHDSAAANKSVRNVLDNLPTKYANASPVIAPLKSDGIWLYRGRLIGYTKTQAFEVCNQLPECMPVAPQN